MTVQYFLQVPIVYRLSHPSNSCKKIENDSPAIECAVEGCKNRRKFQFPKDKWLQTKWLQAIRREDLIPKARTHGLCSNHFDPDDIICTRYGVFGRRTRLKQGSIPSHFPWNNIESVISVRLDCYEEIVLSNGEQTSVNIGNSSTYTKASNQDIMQPEVTGNQNTVWVTENGNDTINGLNDDAYSCNNSNDDPRYSACDDADPLAIFEDEKILDHESNNCLTYCTPLHSRPDILDECKYEPVVSKKIIDHLDYCASISCMKDSTR